MHFRQFLRFFKVGMLVFGLASGFYFLGVLLGALVPANPSFSETEQGIAVFVTTNGFHTDLVLPVRNRRDKCFRVFEHPDFSGKYAHYQYVGLGWGSRNWYLASFDGFPSAENILTTLFIPNHTLMHVEFYRNALQTGKEVKKIVISEAEYEKLVNFADASFAEKDGYFDKLALAGYGENDWFFEAKGQYHLLNTCNIWTGEGLKQAGIKVSAWTPFESGVFFYLK